MKILVVLCLLFWGELSLAECLQSTFKDFGYPECILSPLGNSLEFRYEPASDSDDYFIILQNDKGLQRTYGPFKGFRPPELEWENEYFVALRQGCGSPCWHTSLLPLNETSPARDIGYTYLVDLDRNLLAYFSDDLNGITFENLLSAEKQSVQFPEECPAAFPMSCVENIRIENTELSFEWKEWDRDRREWESARVRISATLESRLWGEGSASNKAINSQATPAGTP